MPKHPKAPPSENIPEGYHRLEGSLRAERKGSRRVGPADPAETMTVSVYVRRRAGAPPLPDQAHWAATPPGQREFLSREEFAATHGAAPEDLQAVVSFAVSHGLQVVETSAARRVVRLSGTVQQMSGAFSVTLYRYEWKKESYRGREGYIHLPNNLAEIVEGVFGLDTRRMARRHIGPPGAAVLTPPQVAGLYNFPTTGAAGQTIAILEFAAMDNFGVTGSGYHAATDIDSFFSGLGLADPTLVAVGVDGATNNPTGDPNGPDGEVALDIDVAGSVATGAKIAVYFAPIGTEADWADIVSTAVHDATNKPSVISTSWGWTELQADAPTGDPTQPWPFEWSAALMNMMSATFQAAAALGVTVFFSAGDAGSDNFQGDGHAHVLYPVSDPWVTGCGGTVITNVHGSSFNEGTWNDVPSGGNGATGGGVSETFDLPAWQVGFGVPASVNAGHHVGRGVPDIAGNASPFSGYNITADGVTQPVGGTSAVAPLYAALIAIINKALGEPVGYLNPTLYALAADPGVTGLFRDINDGVSNGINGAPGYTSGPGWDACTGLGVVDGQNLLTYLQGIYAKSVTITTDRDHFGQDEVDAARTQPGGAVFKGAFFVTVDGFTPTQLGITNSSSLGAAPVVNFSPATGLVNPAVCSSLQSDDPSFGPEVQRFRFGYDVNFGSDDSAFSFMGDSEPVTLSTTFQGITANAQVQFIKQPDPYILQGPQTWWLSNDIRLVQVKEGGSAFGVGLPTGGDPLAFLANLTSALEGGQGIAGGQNFNDNTGEDTEVITVAPDDGHGHKVYNFAIARVHYQGLASTAHKVRVFFRIFAANSTATYFEPDTTFRRYAAYSPNYPVPPADDFENVLPEMGLASGEYVTLPFFGEARQDPSQSGGANTLPSLQTPDGPNTRDLPPTGGPLKDYFYGCWLDINQTDPSSHSRMPAMPPGGNEDGPWPGLSLEPIQQAFITNDHNCIVAEVAFDPVPISTGVAPFNTDKMAQRNISWSYVANPGVEASRRALEPFEVRPTPSILPSGERPDELMIDWNNVPVGQHAEIYLPAVDAQGVVDKAIELYHAERLTRVDAHTIGCTTGGVTYIPLPQGSGDGANFVALMSVNLPYGIHKGQQFTVLVRQVTNASGKPAPPPPPPPPPIQIERLQAPAPPKERAIRWRRVLGTFQVNIPVSTKELILPREERRYSIFRWIGEAMPPQRRWYPVFQRYLTYIGQKVQALGGDPTKILPSPSGDGGQARPPRREECRLEYTGKIAGLIFDHFGDFEGFILETEEKEHTFRSRETEVAELAQHVWRDRLRITVLAECDEPHRPLTMIVREPPTLFSR